MFKSGFVTIIGRPNVGKSTLLNTIMEEKLSIVSSKPQTTRNNIQTILTAQDYQIIFVDTPGIHKPKHKLGEYMVKSAEDSLKEVDLVLFLTTPEINPGRGDEYILEELKNTKTPVFLIVNKIDENTQERVAETLKNYSGIIEFKEYVPISAMNGKNVDTLIELMKKYLPEGPKYYPEDMITDQQERFIVSEIVREKALRLLSEEVPHGIAVDIITMKKNDNGSYEINVNMLCEKDSHKGIIIGKNGSMLKKISKYAREDIEKFLGNKVYLKVWVKVKKDWRDSNSLLKELGYK
ncbi:GTP-binding protein Era [Clostridium tetanomorphum]|uniref:GTPase Era n=1 Tax=Clostridium tetanomorphum TaxID=1553 RepID=A0A923E9U6_CLOTT|nr:GTPase Era [Clostridium tetanomorphum]KAJ53867.1 GTPase Era [Clostridium tetanomorphum DSM 665]MBC2397381.1 GTPase Era [Clostridium tetanomorphum]MBP1862601.1 GTP-binding protein Era [Clostridium tetanomorphum]NRS85558.1 GTP-binding protein Era [Clostridium tetanomorphum]NRZ96431.1 GTP-binding protein Era [Clostridium tetanomorphum]